MRSNAAWLVGVVALCSSVSAQEAAYVNPLPAEPPYYRVRYEGSSQPGELVYQLDADLTGVPTVAGNASPLIEYGVNPYGSQIVVANFWNFFGTFDTAFLTPEQAAKVTLTLGDVDDPQGLRRDLQKLVANRVPVATQVFTSPIVSAEGGPWYPVAQ